VATWERNGHAEGGLEGEEEKGNDTHCGDSW
jgi:hypothetical protein